MSSCKTVIRVKCCLIRIIMQKSRNPSVTINKEVQEQPLTTINTSFHGQPRATCLPRAYQRLPLVKLTLPSVFGLGHPAVVSLALFIVSVASHYCMSLIATIFLSGLWQANFSARDTDAHAWGRSPGHFKTSAQVLLDRRIFVAERRALGRCSVTSTSALCHVH